MTKVTPGKFASSKRWFTITVMSAVLFSVLFMGIALYEANIISFNSNVTNDHLHSVISENEALVQYLDDQKAAEAHFVEIANLIKQDQQNQLTRSMIIVGSIMFVAASIFGYYLSKKLFKPVEDSFKSQERFIQDAAHELRNPLAAMSTIIQNSKANLTSDKTEFLSILNSLQRQIKHLIYINEDLLYLDRPLRSYEGEEVNLSELLLDVVEDLQATANKRGLKINHKIDENLMKAIQAEDFIKLARNLLENALKYGKNKDSKKIDLILEQDGSSIRLVVKDYGIGIPEEDIQNITKRFYRAKNTSKSKGSGLGLAIVKKVVDNYGGKIKIESVVNKYTEVEIKL